MAALLRHGTSRKLGGSIVQRAEAAVVAEGEGRRRLGPRLMHTEEQARGGGITREIQRRTDELYDLIAYGEKNARTSSWRDTWLLMHLCEFVTPRPSQSEWRDIMASKGALRRFRKGGIFSLTFLALDYYRPIHKQKQNRP